MARADQTPRDLLFGLMAVQVGLIDSDQLVATFRDRCRGGGESLAEALVGRGRSPRRIGRR